jgi:hypothetical protein
MINNFKNQFGLQQGEFKLVDFFFWRCGKTFVGTLALQAIIQSMVKENCIRPITSDTLPLKFSKFMIPCVS